VAVWTTDEGLGGVGVHIANDGPRTLSASLRIGLYRDGEVPAERVRVPVELPPRSAASHDLEALIGRFVDASWTYRFGPPAADVIVASLESGPEPGEGQLACAFRFPAGRPHTRESAAALGLEAELTDGGAGLRLRARRVVHGVRVHADGAVPADDAFSLEPGIAREIALGGEPTGGVTVTALNLRDRVRAIS
jgi:beta-mannosidase